MTRYHATLEYLFALQRVGIKLGLDNIRALLAAIDHPQEKWPAIHIAGTNGKGSTAAMVAAVLQEGGYRVGLYTSPHLVDFCERIRINGEMIPVEAVLRYTELLHPIIEEIQPSFFEVTTAMAFRYFADEGVDVAVVETGLGGRLDATNVLEPLVTAITPIDFDHQNYLGNTLREIAAEKAGIIKPGTPCLTNNTDAEVLDVLEKTCQKRAADFMNVYQYGGYEIEELRLEGSVGRLEFAGNKLDALFVNLPGIHQWANALLAVATVFSVADAFPVTAAEIRTGMRRLQWRARLHRVSTNPNVVIDASHNPAGFHKTLTFLQRFFSKEQIQAVVFLQNDKDYRRIAELLTTYVKKVYAVDLNLGKPLPAVVLQRAVAQAGGDAEVMPGLETIIDKIRSCRDQQMLWLIIGSHYLAGAAYPYFTEGKE